MANLIECLNCGESRQASRDGMHRIHLDDSCPRCGYVGWAQSGAVTRTPWSTQYVAPQYLMTLPRRRLLNVA